MDFLRQTTRRLHEEHETTFESCARLEQALAARGRGAPAADDPTWRSFARRIETELGQEVARHFAFEEQSLFPRLEANGEGEIAALLAEEHAVIRECAQEFLALLARSCAQGVEAVEWQRLSSLGHELSERLVGHAQKEEMALLPALDDLLDDDEDRALFADYAMG